MNTNTRTISFAIVCSMMAWPAAAAFPIIQADGSTEITFKLIDGQCIPESLLDEVGGIARIDRPTQGGKVCCPASLTMVSPKIVPTSTWSRVKNFSAARGAKPLSQSQLCAAEPMPDDQLQRLVAKAAAADHKEAQQRAADEKRPIPSNWLALSKSTVQADQQMVKSIEKMQWWNACTAWGREARARDLSRRGVALQQYLQQERLINVADLRNAKARQPVIGQTACGAYAILGLPDKVNTSENSTRTSQQIIYRSRGIYVYTDGAAGDHNGIVRSLSY